jgi:dienelactone hydrolase
LKAHYLSAILALSALTGADLPRGRVVDPVIAAGNPAQSYALYLPSSYTPGHAWPILYCLDPGARGRLPVERFAQAAEKAGFIVAGSNNCRNGPAEPEQEAIFWLATDTQTRLAIDTARLYMAGMSGGARVALGLAQNGSVAGVIACAAGFGNRLPKQVPFRLYATAGVDDFNYDELYENSLELARRGIAHRFVEFDGGHDWLPEPLAAEALDFFLGKVPPQAAQPSKHQQKLAGHYDDRVRQVRLLNDADKRALLGELQKDAAKPEDSDKRRIARRVLMGTFVGSMEQGRQLLAGKKYDDAAHCFEVALMARPSAAEMWYSLAVAKAAAGRGRESLEALEEAVSNGFHDRARLEGEPLLERIHNEPRYRAVVEKLK